MSFDVKNIARILIIMFLPVGCSKPMQHSANDQQITFAPKTYYELGQDTAYEFVYMAGTLTGKGIGYPNNTVSITCYKDQMQCFACMVWQIGQNQIGRLDAPTVFRVENWNADGITASELGMCVKTTVTIIRKSEALLWVQEPVNQAAVICKDADTRVLKWTIEDPPWSKSPGLTDHM